MFSLIISLLFFLVSIESYILKRWPLSKTLPVENLYIDGSTCGPNGTAMCKEWNTGSCHDPGSNCNQCRSNEPHIFYITWCADTVGYRGITCDLDLGYRSAQGARYGLFEYSIKGRNSTDDDFTNKSTVVFPDSPFPFSHFAIDSGKNDILTVYQLSLVEGNTDGDNLELTDTSGYCCRATFSGGKTVTGTLYIGDLTIRANSLAASPSPKASSTPVITNTPSSSPNSASNTIPYQTSAGFSESVLGGLIIGGIVVGVLSTLVIKSFFHRNESTGTLTLPRFLTSISSSKDERLPGPTSSLLGSSRIAQIERARRG